MGATQRDPHKFHISLPIGLGGQPHESGVDRGRREHRGSFRGCLEEGEGVARSSLDSFLLNPGNLLPWTTLLKCWSLSTPERKATSTTAEALKSSRSSISRSTTAEILPNLLPKERRLARQPKFMAAKHKPRWRMSSRKPFHFMPCLYIGYFTTFLWCRLSVVCISLLLYRCFFLLLSTWHEAEASSESQHSYNKQVRQLLSATNLRQVERQKSKQPRTHTTTLIGVTRNEQCNIR